MVEIDFSKKREMLALMDRADEFPEMLFGKNEKGEKTNTSINPDCIIHNVYQKDGWILTQTLYRNGVIEEIYEH